MTDESLPNLTPDEMERYGRHLLLPDVGRPGQARLKRASVLIVGVGGLGCPAALYLALAGVGRLGLVDGDRVEASNLHRQPLYGDADVGRLKVEAAAARLRQSNAGVRIDAHPVRLDAANAARLVADYDLILDGADNFPTRYLVNDACVLGGKPLVQGSVHRFDGQVAVFHHEGGPCYRCLFVEAPPADAVPDCAEAGVLGVLPGLVGTLQATEAIKLLAGIGRPLSGRLLLYDALGMTFRTLPAPRDPQCPVCGERPTIRELRAEPGCAAPELTDDDLADDDMTHEELGRRLRGAQPPLLLDVRQPDEFAAGHLPGAMSIPLGGLDRRLGELDPRGEWVVYCLTGARSRRAVEVLRRHGFSRARNLRGGCLAWSRLASTLQSRDDA